MNADLKLQRITSEIARCEHCPLYLKRKNTVPGTGNPNAKILFIGEAPGRNEDNTGQPFCGASGKLLDELLDSIQLSREDIFITNIVKCRPPDNRDPLADEKTTCSQRYLKKQINIINPTLIVTLGRHALNHFLPDSIISQCHGQIVKDGNLTILPLYHPAAAIYNRSKKDILLEDFQKIKSFTDNKS